MDISFGVYHQVFYLAKSNDISPDFDILVVTLQMTGCCCCPLDKDILGMQFKYAMFF